MTVATAGKVHDQDALNKALVENSHYMRDQVVSKVIPFTLSADDKAGLTDEQVATLRALEIDAGRIAIESVNTITQIGEVDHLGGGLDLIPALTMTLALTDYDKVEYTIEHAHTSIGYFSSLATRGFLDRKVVIDQFRQGLDIPGHVAWVPGGTPLNGGRLGVMIASAVGQALGKKARHGEDAWVICHCGDAGWISGQALNGFNAADLHDAPVTFIMHRNGIQLSGSNEQIMDKDPRPIIEAMGITIIETPSLHDAKGLFKAYQQARALARKGRPSLIYPTGYQSSGSEKVDLNWFAAKYGIPAEVSAYAEKQGVAMDTEVWVPGALMSFRDLECMMDCLFLVNNLPGGQGHHDGSLKGRDVNDVLANPMLTLSDEDQRVLEGLSKQSPVSVTTKARPASGTANLVLSKSVVGEVTLPEAGKKTSARAGVQVAYEAIAKSFPEDMFVLDCDLAPSTKLDKARKVLARDHQFELSIEEQVAAIMANGLACSSDKPQFIVFGTFAAFFEGIAREGFEMWRYQRNLNGVNEGLNVTYHLSHVGACTGRDHFSGWSLDWISLGIGYLPYLHRVYAPADARSAFIAVKDAAAHYGAHIVAIPRDNLPVLSKPDGSALWDASDEWETITPFRKSDGASHAILAFGAPAFLAEEAAETLAGEGRPTDVYVINGLPFESGALEKLAANYPGGLVTIEDGLIGTREVGLRGFAGLVAGVVGPQGTPVAHVGITDPRIAPSEGHMEVWEHFGLTADNLVATVQAL